VERIQGMFGVESYKPARASRLHMWSGCPKARIRLPTEIGRAGSSKRLCREYGCSLRRVRCQANGLAYASTLGWMRVEPQQRNAHPTEEPCGSMNLPNSFAERINLMAHHSHLKMDDASLVTRLRCDRCKRTWVYSGPFNQPEWKCPNCKTIASVIPRRPW
jgi:hypothetical protein